MKRPLDVIAVRGLSADAVHGVLPEERLAAQPFVVDLALWIDASGAASSDDLADTVSYADIADEVALILTGPAVRLIETLGYRIADAVLAHELVRGVEVTVHKPEAPIAQPFADVSVTVRRGECGPLPALVADPLLGAAEDEAAADTPPTSGSAAPLSAPPASAGGPPEDDPATPALEAEPASPARRAAAPVSRAVLALGGNIGDTPSILARALESLVDDPRVEVVAVSPILRTSPVLAEGQAPQADYWNAVVLLDTALDPRALLELAHTLEARAHRVRVEHWGPRTLDVDLIDYDGVELDDPELVLPHPRASRRAFVLAPWLMADPSARLSGRPLAELLAEAPDREGILDAVDEWYLDPFSIIADSDAVLAGTAGSGVDAAPEAEADGIPGSQAEGPGALTAAATDLPPSGPSRLDLVPEESRVGLAPSAEAEDLVWQRLWARWAAPTPAADADAAAPAEEAKLAEDAPAPREDLLRPPVTPPADPAPTEEAGSEEGDETRARTSAADTAPRARDAQENPAPLLAPDSAQAGRTPDNEAARDEEAAAPKEKRPRWLPLFGRAENRSEALAPERAAPRGAQADSPLAQRPSWDSVQNPDAEPAAQLAPRSPRRLPSWDFARADVRIVDEPGAVAEVPAQAESPAETTLVDPRLPEGALRGPRPDAEHARTSLRRSVIVRPSTTGAIPIVKDQDAR